MENNQVQPSSDSGIHFSHENAPNQPISANNRDKLFVFIALVLGFLFCELILFEGFGVSVPVYMALFYASVYWYLKGRPGGINRKGLPLLLPIALLCACFALYDNMTLACLNFLLLVILVLLQLVTLTGNRLFRTFSLGLVIDLFHAGVVLPLANIPAPFKALRRSPRAGGKVSRLGPVLIGLAISVPLLAIVLGLLSNADDVFEKSLKGILTFLNKHIMEYLFKLIIGMIIAIPGFGLLQALRQKRAIGGLRFNVNYDRVKFIDEGIMSTIFTLLNAVYLVFIAIQFSYLFNAFSGTLPQGFLFSTYARRGFFELMGVVVINLGMLCISYLFNKRRKSGAAAFLKTMETVLVALTLLLIASALSKMALYMNVMGLTLLRVYTSWFMLLCAVVFVALLVKLYLPKFALTRFCSVAFLVMFLALNFVDVDARIPQYNIYRYTSGHSKTVDVDIFNDLSDSMVPYAAKLLDMDDKVTAAKVAELLSYRASNDYDNRWQVSTVARENAKKVLAAKGIAYNPWFDRRN